MDEVFRRLTIGDQGLLAGFGDPDRHDPRIRRLDDRTESLLRIAALVALDAPQSFYGAAIDAAMRAGLEVDDVVAVLPVIAGPVGSVRITSAAPKIALAAGYDVEAALDLGDSADHVSSQPTSRP
jgi:4-carboxymuconolactone decarboxylase